MRLDPEKLLGPLVALLLLVFIGQQTGGALRAAGVWGHRRAGPPVVSPYTRLEALLAPVAARTDSSAGRDPFGFGRAAVATPARVAAPRTRAPAPAPARPVLTAIVWSDASPSATIRWNGHDYSVQANTLFDDFRVASITRDQVTLERGAETLVLQLPKKGD